MVREYKRRSVAERLLSKVRKGNEAVCWEWTASKDRDGYGKIMIDYKLKLAHRVSYELHCGPIADGMRVCHRCDNPSCINPDHLFLGTQAENMADMGAKGRRAQIKGSARGTAKLTDTEVIAIRSATGILLRELAERYGVSTNQISFIRLGKQWKYLLPTEQPTNVVAEKLAR